MSKKKLEIGICDDNPKDLERIQRTLIRCMEALGERDVSVSLFQETRKLYEESRRRVFGLVFLDVVMPGLNGLDLASQMGMKKDETRVVFVSNHESMVFDSYDYAPLWFVRKSMLEQDMFRALRKYQQVTARKRITYRIKNGLGVREVLLDDLMYIECEKHTLKIRMSDGTVYQVYGSLRPREEELSIYGFLRIHKSFLVNQRYVKEVCKRNVQLRDGTELDMGKARRKDVMEAMDQYERGETL